MKKVIFIMMLFIVSLTLKAVEPTIKFYFEDGFTNEFKIEDISEMNFIKSYAPYLMAIYTTNGIITYDIAEITSMVISTTPQTFTVVKSDTAFPISLETIDSIIFVPNIYHEITIGSQTWMGKNLEVDHYRNGDPIPQVADSAEWYNLKTGAWCYYNNDPANGAIYGKLYNWYAVHDPRGLAPEGWHIPSYTEWMRLSTSTGGDLSAGGRLKSTGTLENADGLWQNPNTGATNQYRFSALPGGYRYISGTFYFLGQKACWWSSSLFNSTNVWFRELNFDMTEFSKYDAERSNGFSIRCVKDFGSDIPTVNSISPVSGVVGDIVTISGSNFGSTQGTSCVSFNLVKLQPSDYQSWSDKEIIAKVPLGATTGSVSVTINGVKSNEVDFTITGTTQNKYPCIAIGTQVWMTKNLDVDHYRNGDVIPEVTDSAAWVNLKTGAWCYYNNNSATRFPFGKLYNWYAVNDPRGLAPDGWHVASDGEWSTLINFLDGQYEAGGKLKETGTTHWQIPNIKATNESGFTAVPGGFRARFEEKAFTRFGDEGYWWTSSEKSDTSAICHYIQNTGAFVITSNNPKADGLSVRCIVGNESNTPTITLISPAAAELGNIITISGSNFGSYRGNSFVSFNDINPKPEDYQSWYDTEIRVKVPVGAITGKLSLTVNGTKSNDMDFEVTNFTNPPLITSITPTSAEIYGIITIKGENFGPTRGKSFVTFGYLNSQESEYISWSENEIKVKVTPGAPTGKVFVTVSLIESNKVDFTVIYNIDSGTVTDIDGNIYKTEKINGKWWMAENLKVVHYRNGNPIPQVTDNKEWKTQLKGGWCFYDNNKTTGVENGVIYGKLYNWYAVGDERGLAPEGWHIATDEEWMQLASYFGGDTLAGGKLKSTGTKEKGDGLWFSPNTGASNVVGFTALPGGTRTGDGLYVNLGYEACWWRPTSGSVSGAWYRSINNKSEGINRVYDEKTAGFSVRCVKD